MTTKLTNSILKKWKKQGSFIRFLNGDKNDLRVSNLAYVSLQEAMEHIHDWVVDWDLNLNNREKMLVLFDENWRNGLIFH